MKFSMFPLSSESFLVSRVRGAAVALSAPRLNLVLSYGTPLLPNFFYGCYQNHNAPSSQNTEFIRSRKRVPIAFTTSVRRLRAGSPQVGAMNESYLSGNPMKNPFAPIIPHTRTTGILGAFVKAKWLFLAPETEKFAQPVYGGQSLSCAQFDSLFARIALHTNNHIIMYNKSVLE